MSSFSASKKKLFWELGVSQAPTLEGDQLRICTKVPRHRREDRIFRPDRFLSEIGTSTPMRLALEGEVNSYLSGFSLVVHENSTVTLPLE